MVRFLNIIILAALLVTLPHHLVKAQDVAREEALKALDNVLDSSDTEMRPITPNTQQQVQEVGPTLFDRIKIIEMKTQIEPTNVTAWTELGNLYFDADLPSLAIQAYKTSLNLEPGNPNVITDLGVMYHRVGELDMALECFDKAIAINPGHINASFNKSVVLKHDKKDRAAALAVLKNLAAKNPKAVLPGNKPVAQAIQELSQ